MACERNNTKISRTGGIKAGISATSSKVGGLIGQITTVAARKTGQVSTAVLSIANSFEGPRTLAALTPLAAVAALLAKKGQHKGVRNDVLNVLAAVNIVRAGGASAGTGIARLSRAEQIQQLDSNQGPAPIQTWSSKLTPAFNARDIAGLPGIKIRFSAGRMFETRGQSWHLGTTVVDMSHGEQRAITHLQSMTVPGAHYYFERALKDDEVAKIISGQRGYDPKHTPGFAGMVTELESLSPSTAALKRSLIRAHLFWGNKLKPVKVKAGGKKDKQSVARTVARPLEHAEVRIRRVTGAGYDPATFNLEMGESLSRQFTTQELFEVDLYQTMDVQKPPKQVHQPGRGTVYILQGGEGDVHYSRTKAGKARIEAVIPQKNTNAFTFRAKLKQAIDRTPATGTR